MYLKGLFMMKTKIIAIFVVFSMMFAMGAIAKKNMVHNKEMRAEIMEYRKTNIIPELNKFKTEIDNKLSADDLKELNVLRGKAKTLAIEAREAHREKMQMKRDEVATKKNEMKDDPAGDRKNKRKMNREEMKERFGKGNPKMKADFKKITEDLKAISERNPELHKQIDAKFGVQSEKWHTDIKSIVDKHRTAAQAEKESLKENKGTSDSKVDGKSRRRIMESNGGPRMGGKGKGVMMAYLWDGDDFLGEMPEMQADFMTVEANEIDNNVAIAAPNPSTAITTISFDAPTNDKVVFEVFDVNGNIVHSEKNKDVSKGNNEFKFNPGEKNLPIGNYYFNIKGNIINKFGKFSYQK